MKPQKLILLALLTIIFSACSIKITKDAKVKSVTKSINGDNFKFTNLMRHETKQFNLFRKEVLTNDVKFDGFEKPINLTIPKDDFLKEIDVRRVEFLFIDSVSFSINNARDAVDLIYYVNLGVDHKKAVFTIEKKSDKWRLKKS